MNNFKKFRVFKNAAGTPDSESWNMWYVEAMEQLVEIVQHLSQARSIDEIMVVVRKAARELMGADGATFILREGDFCHYAEENAIAPLWKGKRFPMHSCISGWVMLNSRPAIIADIYADPRIPADLYRQTFVKSLAMVPIRKNAPVGAIGTYWSQQREINEQQLTILEALANVTAVAMENVTLYTRLMEEDRRKNEFMAILAHELRGPLAPMSNALTMLQKGNLSPQRQGEAQDVIGRQLKQLVHLVDDLMDITRLTQNRIELRREETPLSGVIASAVETVRPQMQAKGQNLTVTLPEMLAPMEIDPVRLGQVFVNLLDNAVKYTPVGGAIVLEAQVNDEDDTLDISVSDNGIGIPATKLPQIFEIFSQVDSSIERAQGGLGIGLSLVRTLVELHGGKVTAHSDGENTGTRITVCLPLPVQPQATRNDDDEEEEEMSGTAATRVLRILVVDDNIEAAQTMVWMMEALGHDVRMAHNGPAAIQAATTFLPEVVLLDIGLPGMNGYDVCKAMRLIPALESAAMVAHTGWSQPEYRERSVEAGFNHHLVKPADLKAIEALLQEYETKGAQNGAMTV